MGKKTMGKEARANALAREITQKAADEGRILEVGWLAFKAVILPKEASEAQANDMRIAYFTGAQHLFSSIMSTMDEDHEPTQDDIVRLEKISLELEVFEDHMRKTLNMAPADRPKQTKQ